MIVWLVLITLRPPLLRWLVAAVTVIALVSCSEDSDRTADTTDTTDTTDTPSVEVETIDVTVGAYRGVRLGSSKEELISKLGRGVSQGRPTTLSNPQGDDGSPPVIGSGAYAYVPRSIQRYRHLVASLANRRVHTLLIDDPDAATAEGVAIGDPLDRVAEVYADAICGRVNERSEYKPYSACYLKRGERYTWFGPDPIRSITLSLTRIDDLSPK